MRCLSLCHSVEVNQMIVTCLVESVRNVGDDRASARAPACDRNTNDSFMTAILTETMKDPTITALAPMIAGSSRINIRLD